MRFFCDLHVHSRFSRATSKSLTIRELGRGAAKKGITVLGTGDFTHPSWIKELDENLVDAEPGLFKLTSDTLPVRFMLTGEISTIYKQGDTVRKVHHLVVAPDMNTARKIATGLAQRGNITSDGRPILGITSRDLLEIVLEAGEGAFLIPAHIWTPWFSALGSKSGFDSIPECYLDLEPHIFAVETGLSSDPPMNWMVSSLDRYHLVSNSDAHSAEKVAREATIFDCNLDYFAMMNALKDGQGLLGTVEFFPEEGKYHLDGHRECGVSLSPSETRELGGICPVCGRKVTVGVLHRVEALSDRGDGERPGRAKSFHSLIPLKEILSEILETGSSSKKVEATYERLVGTLGGELQILMDVDIDDITTGAGEVIACAISRMRAGEVHREAGFDGKFGRVRVFRDGERDLLFGSDIFARRSSTALKGSVHQPVVTFPMNQECVLNEEQRSAVEFNGSVLTVQAGPGTGKTRVLVERMKALKNTDAGCSILAVTFTTRAAREISQRFGSKEAEVFTFHSLASRILHRHGLSFAVADDAMLRKEAASLNIEDAASWIDDLLLRMSTQKPLKDEQAAFLAELRETDCLPYEGLIEEAIRILRSDQSQARWNHILVDEFQDINPIQYAFLKEVSRNVKSLMVIGDANQAIYGFRGSSEQAFEDFTRDYPAARTLVLKDTYRLSSPICSASNAFVGSVRVRASRKGEPLRLIETPAPVDFIAREIESLAGGLTHSTVGSAQAEYGLSDIAVIVRTQQQAQPVIDALRRASIPYDTAYAQSLAEKAGIGERLGILEGTHWEEQVKGVGDQAMERITRGVDPGIQVMKKLTEASNLVKSLDGPIHSRIRKIEGSGLFKLVGLEDTHPFYQYAALFGSDLDGFIEFCRLSNDQGGLGGERVHVITAHAAKGLEFRCVFITGLVRGLFPLTGSPISEERNLFYVAMTRASDRLYLLYTGTNRSEFLNALPLDHCRVHRERIRQTSEQMLLF